MIKYIDFQIQKINWKKDRVLLLSLSYWFSSIYTLLIIGNLLFEMLPKNQLPELKEELYDNTEIPKKSITFIKERNQKNNLGYEDLIEQGIEQSMVEQIVQMSNLSKDTKPSGNFMCCLCHTQKPLQQQKVFDDCGHKFCQDCLRNCYCQQPLHKCDSDRRKQQQTEKEIRNLERRRSRQRREKMNRFCKLSPLIIILGLLTIFDFLAGSSESVCLLIPIEGMFLTIPFKTWLLNDAYIWMISIVLLILGGSFSEKQKSFIFVTLIIGLLLYFAKGFWMLVGIDITWRGGIVDQIGCKLSPIFAIARVCTIPLTFLMLCLFLLIVSALRR